jgi:hypothetical protein
VSYTSLDQQLAAQIALDGIAFATVVAAAMFTLWNRGSAASSQSTFYPPRANAHGITVKRVWDTLILCGLACVAIGRGAALSEAGYFAYRHVLWEIENMPYTFSWCYVGFLGLHLINLPATGFTIRTRIWRTYNARDKPTNGVVWGVWPFMILYCGWYIGRTLYDYINDYSSLSLLLDVVLGSILYAGMALSILIPGLKQDLWQAFMAKPHQTWVGASNYVGPSMQQPVVYTTPAPRQLVYAVQPQQQQYAPAGMMMHVPVQGGYIQGHFIPATSVPQQPIAQPASDPPRSSVPESASTSGALASPQTISS